jgi:hypothetical protein
MNKEERKLYNKNYDKNHKEARRQRQCDYRKRTKSWLVEYRVSKGCKNCGEKHPACLDFHHINRNKHAANFSGLVNLGYGKARLIKEISKCDVLCSNCHRKLHWEENKDN